MDREVIHRFYREGSTLYLAQVAQTHQFSPADGADRPGAILPPRADLLPALLENLLQESAGTEGGSFRLLCRERGSPSRGSVYAEPGIAGIKCRVGLFTSTAWLRIPTACGVTAPATEPCDRSGIMPDSWAVGTSEDGASPSERERGSEDCIRLLFAELPDHEWLE